MDFDEIVKQGVEAAGGKIGDDSQETVVEETTQQSTEQATQETTQATTQTENTTSVFDLKAFNEKFSRTFNDENEILNLFEKATKSDELERNFSELSQKYTEIEEAAIKGVDWQKWFKNEDEFKRQQFLMKHGDEYNEEAINVLNKLTPSSIEKMNAWDVLKTSLLLDKDIEGGEQAVVDLLMDKYGVDTDSWDSMDTKVKNQIKLDAKAARASLKGLYDGIELPRAVDPVTRSSQLKEVWESPLKDIVSGIDKLHIAEGIEFAVPEDLRSGIAEELMTEVVRGRMTPSVEVGAELAARARERILMRNLDKIVAHVENLADAKAKEKYRAKVENNEPVNNEAGNSEAGTTSQKALVDFLVG